MKNQLNQNQKKNIETDKGPETIRKYEKYKKVELSRCFYGVLVFYSTV